jgi:hypothetical protein
MSAFDPKRTSLNFDWINSGGSMIMPERRARRRLKGKSQRNNTPGEEQQWQP